MTNQIPFTLPNQKLLNSVTEYNLICDSSWLNSFLTSITFIGFLVGAAVGGYLRFVLEINFCVGQIFPKKFGKILGENVFNALK